MEIKAHLRMLLHGKVNVCMQVLWPTFFATEMAWVTWFFSFWWLKTERGARSRIQVATSSLPLSHRSTTHIDTHHDSRYRGCYFLWHHCHIIPRPALPVAAHHSSQNRPGIHSPRRKQHHLFFLWQDIGTGTAGLWTGQCWDFAKKQQCSSTNTKEFPVDGWMDGWLL